MTIPEFIIQSILDQILTFLVMKGQDFSNDVSIKKQIKYAIQSTVKRFESEYPDKSLTSALINNADFFTLPSVQAGIRNYLANPLAKSPTLEIIESLASFLPSSRRKTDAVKATEFFLACLRQEIGGISKLQGVMELAVQAKMLKTLESIDETLRPEVPSLEFAQKKYIKYIIETNKYIDPRGILQTRRSFPIKLDQVFITLKAEYDVQDFTDFDKFLENYRESNELQEFDDVLRSSLSVGAIQKDKLFSLNDVLRNNSRVVILGDPGSGKTTLMKYVTYIFALQYSKNIEERTDERVLDNEHNDYGRLRLPIFIRIANYADAFSANRNISLRDFILDGLSDSSMRLEELQIVFEEAIDSGNALVLLDGLDEVVNVSDRAEIGRRIEKFIASCNPRNRFVITSRVAGYRVVPLAGDFSHYTIQEFDNEQIHSFLRKWCLQVVVNEASKDEQIKKAHYQADSIYNAIKLNAGIRLIASNPLMLAILVLVFRNENKLSARRFEIYEKAVRILIKDWQKAKGLIQYAVIKEHEIFYILSPLAYWIHENKVSRLASEQEIKSQLLKYFEALKDSADGRLTVLERADDFFSRVVDVGLLAEFSPNRFGFLHLSFQEYFVAKYVLQQANEIDRIVHEHRHMPSWLEPITLLISGLYEGSEDSVVSIVQKAVLADFPNNEADNMLPSKHEIILHRDLLLAARIIAECSNVDKRLYYVIAKFLDVLIYCRLENKFDGLRRRMDGVIHILIETGKGPILGNLLAQLLTLIISEEKQERREGLKFSVSVGLLKAQKLHGAWKGGETQKTSTSSFKIGKYSDLISEKFFVCIENFVKEYRISTKHLDIALNDLEKLSRTDNSMKIVVGKEEKQFHQNSILNDDVEVFRKMKLSGETRQPDTGDDFILLEKYRNLNSVRSSSDQNLVEFLQQAIKNRSGLVRYEVVRCIRVENVRHRNLETVVLSALKDPLDDVCIEAASTLMQWNLISNELVTWLISTSLNRSNLRHLRSFAIKAFTAINLFTIDVINLLLKLSSDPDWRVRGDAISTLGSQGVFNQQVFEICMLLLDDEIDYVQSKSAEALASIASNSETPDFVKEAIADKVYVAIINTYGSSSLQNALWEALWQSTAIQR